MQIVPWASQSIIKKILQGRRGEYFDMHRQTQNHIYDILINSFLLIFHEKKKKKKKKKKIFLKN